MPLMLNSNYKVLTPKVQDADSVDRFQPIVMANFLFKVVTKILADRLGGIAARIIDSHQFGFVKERHITDSIVVASECIGWLNWRCHSGNMALKIDIRKAFDTLEWDFLLAVLRYFGFSAKFCDWILPISESAKVSILINGSTHGYFDRTRGVR